MSGDAHAGGHAHDGHDHGHDHAHGEGWTANQKSVALAAFVIAALLATGYYLVKRGEALHGKAHATPEKVVGAEPHATKADVAIRRPTKAYPAGGIGGRQRFADQHERRMKRRGHDLKVQATGDEGTIFELAYSPNAADHLEELKRAIPFQRYLRSLGFKKMVLKVGTREVWSKDL